MNRKEIIDTAFKVWGRNFYRKTSLSQLAAELKVSKTALYRHFDNKQALTTAMTECFFDDFSISICNDFKNAREKDADEGIFTLIQCISGYFVRNVFSLVFFLMNIYDRNLNKKTITESLISRNVDMDTFQTVIEKKYKTEPAVVQLIFATMIFFISNFHKTKVFPEQPASDAEINKMISVINKIIMHGLGYSAENTAIDFNKLEIKAEETAVKTEPQPFFRAVAEAVAEAGPWDVSMDMVAKKLGLSKSSLYGHFKNKKDMLRRLFVSEFERIIEFAKQGIKLSSSTTEQLYLGLFSIAVYLRSRPEILIVMGWIRTRKLDFGKPHKKYEIFRLFEDVNIEPVAKVSDDEKQRISHWMLFLLINILSHSKTGKTRQFPWLCDEINFPQENSDSENTLNKNIRLLYKFITLGLGGFIQ